VRLLPSTSKHIRDIEFSGTHQFADIAVRSEVLFRILQPAILIAILCGEVFNF